MGYSVFIIGNGFDLNLGLSTSYKDYMSSDFFKRNLCSGNELFDYLDSKTSIENWIDIEKELSVASKTGISSYSSFFKEYKLLCSELINYLSTVDVSSLNRESEAYKFLERSFNENTLILNFNYTDSVKSILRGSGFSESLISRNVKHVHGSIEGGDIIFGVDDNSRIDPDHTFLYKSTSNIYDGRICRASLKEFNDLFIFGHSLGESDHMYFDFFHDLCIFEDFEKKVTLFYYKDEGKHMLYKQLHALTSNKVSRLKSNVNFEEVDLSM